MYFLGIVIEEIIAQIPSTIIVLASSFFMLQNLHFNLDSFLILLINIGIPVGLGMVVGSSVIYAFCYYLGKSFVVKWGKYLGLKWSDIEKFNKKISNQKRDSFIVYISRTIPVIPSVAISGFCGVVRYNFKKYLILTFLGGMSRAVIVGFIGWQFGAYNEVIASHMNHMENIIFIIIILTIISYFTYRKLHSNRN